MNVLLRNRHFFVSAKVCVVWSIRNKWEKNIYIIFILCYVLYRGHQDLVIKKKKKERNEKKRNVKTKRMLFFVDSPINF